MGHVEAIAPLEAWQSAHRATRWSTGANQRLPPKLLGDVRPQRLHGEAPLLGAGQPRVAHPRGGRGPPPAALGLVLSLGAPGVAVREQELDAQEGVLGQLEVGPSQQEERLRPPCVASRRECARESLQEQHAIQLAACALDRATRPGDGLLGIARQEAMNPAAVRAPGGARSGHWREGVVCRRLQPRVEIGTEVRCGPLPRRAFEDLRPLQRLELRELEGSLRSHPVGRERGRASPQLEGLLVTLMALLPVRPLRQRLGLRGEGLGTRSGKRGASGGKDRARERGPAPWFHPDPTSRGSPHPTNASSRAIAPTSRSSRSSRRACASQGPSVGPSPPRTVPV